jgi:hypothetical protein
LTRAESGWPTGLGPLLPRARIETIPAGHLIHDAEPAAFTEVALSFLQRAAAKPGQP